MSRFTKVLSSIGLSSPQATPVEWEENGALRSAVSSADLANLLGTTPLAQVEVDMWLTFSLQDISDAQLNALNEVLLFKTFLVGSSISLADYSVYVAVASSNFGKHSNVKRWFKHVQAIAKPVEGITAIADASVFVPIFIPFPLIDGEVSKAGEAAPAPAPAPAVAAAAAPAPAHATPAAAVAAPEGKKAKEGKTKEAKAAPAAAAPAAEDASSGALDPTKLDIRCGVVLKCWNHPDSEKLLCEEIDMGGGDVRSIASGIRAHYEAEQLVGKKVVVLCNLKERSIGGFKSQVCPLYSAPKNH